MNPDIKVSSNKLASFETLAHLGVQNFFTFDNSKWANVVPRFEKTEYLEIFESMKFPTGNTFYLGAEHLDNIRVIDQSNIELYTEFTRFEKYENSIKLNIVNCDGIITKEEIAILVAPADCAILCFTGVDKSDGKRFIAVIHAGIFGTMLDIHKKAVDRLKSVYEFDVNDLEVFIYPTIFGKDYIKSKSDKTRGKLFSDLNWTNYVVDQDDSFEIHFQNKIIDDLEMLGIEDIHDSELNPYDENKNGKLFSYSYQKNQKLEEFRNFLVGMKLE